MEAVSASGYPLQTLVASSLRAKFHRVQEEWSYIDRDSGDLRTLDVLATKRCSDAGPRQRPVEGQLDPGLALLIECKQSRLPYVFFLSSSRPYVPDFPLITGLPSLSVRMKDDTGSWADVSKAMALSLDRRDFVTEASYCTAFAKCYRKKNIELSGSEPFNNLILPLSKALDHYENIESYRGAINYVSHLAIGLGVLDAPLVGIHVSEDENKAVLLPWVRVVRHETTDRRERQRRGKLFAIDVVHKAFLQTYLDEHLFPFVETFSSVVARHRESLVSGSGSAIVDEPRLELFS